MDLLSPQLKRLLGFVRPYLLRLVVGVVFLAVVALAEGAIVFLIVPIVDRVLNPSASDSLLPLFTVPFTDPPRLEPGFALSFDRFSDQGPCRVPRQHADPIGGPLRGDQLAQPGVRQAHSPADWLFSAPTRGAAHVYGD